MDPGASGGEFQFNIQFVNRICCVGAGRIGVLSTLVMASNWPDKRFYIVDEDAAQIERWQGPNLPIYEPGLDQLIQQTRGINVHFCPNLPLRVNTAEIIFLALEIRTKQKGEGKQGRMDLMVWEKTVRRVLASCNRIKLIIDKSPFPVMSRNYMRDIINEYPLPHRVLSNPEFFPQGTAINYLRNPNRVVIGIINGTEHDVFVLTSIYSRDNWVPDQRFIVLDNHKAVELGRLACSTLLGVIGTLANDLTIMCDEMNIQINDVVNVITSDIRLGNSFGIGMQNQNALVLENAFINPSVALGGPGLQRDIAYMAYLAEVYNMKDTSKMLKIVIESNKSRKLGFVKKMLDEMISLKNKIILVFGFSFKANTEDISDSPALFICERLWKHEGAILRIYDPLVRPELIRSCFPRNVGDKMSVIGQGAEQFLNSCMGADALCFLTKSPGFGNLNFEVAFQQMQRPSFFF